LRRIYRATSQIFFDFDGYKRPYHKERFELVQAHKGKPTHFFLDPALHFVNSTMVANDWHSVYAALHMPAGINSPFT
jgi:hypothetical protein